MHTRHDTGQRDVMSWGTKVWFAYADDAGVVACGNWRIEYDTDAQRAEHERLSSFSPQTK